MLTTTIADDEKFVDDNSTKAIKMTPVVRICCKFFFSTDSRQDIPVWKSQILLCPLMYILNVSADITRGFSHHIQNVFFGTTYEAITSAKEDFHLRY
jgi:hypothetical protein